MPQMIPLDEMPTGDDDWPTISDPLSDGDKVPCPECGEMFKSRGLTRHLRITHGVAGTSTPTRTSNKSAVVLADRWAEFQRGAALFVSFACPLCASVLVEDAQTDGKAIADFAANRPKVRKQLEQMLTGMDTMILVGALAGTARKMIEHHALGVRLGLAAPRQHSEAHGAAEKMMDFLGSMPQETRMDLLNQVFAARQQANGTQPVSTVVTQPQQDTQQQAQDDDDVPGSPPGVTVPLTQEDRRQVAMAHSGSEFASTNAE